MGNPQQRNEQRSQKPDFGELPDLEDLMAMARLDASDVDEAIAWLEDNVPEAAKAILGE